MDYEQQKISTKHLIARNYNINGNAFLDEEYVLACVYYWLAIILIYFCPNLRRKVECYVVVIRKIVRRQLARVGYCVQN